jgi:hypothetical protein
MRPGGSCAAPPTKDAASNSYDRVLLEDARCHSEVHGCPAVVSKQGVPGTLRTKFAWRLGGGDLALAATNRFGFILLQLMVFAAVFLLSLIGINSHSTAFVHQQAGEPLHVTWLTQVQCWPCLTLLG